MPLSAGPDVSSSPLHPTIDLNTKQNTNKKIITLDRLNPIGRRLPRISVAVSHSNYY